MGYFQFVFWIIFSSFFPVPVLLQMEPEPGSNYMSLGHYITDAYITVSGISAGGAFSMMLSFIHSSFVKGAGIFAGAPYPVAIVALEKLWNIGNLTAMTTWIDHLVEKGWIDDPHKNMKSNLGAFIYHGSSDQLVPHFFSEMNLKEFAHYGVPRIQNMIGKVPSGHCFPINATRQAYDHRLCSIGFPGAVCACGYPGIYDMFSFFYQEHYKPPAYEPGTSGHLYKFNQDEFFDSGNAKLHGFYPHGYAYVPFRCRLETGIRCKLHFAFQGCSQSFVDLRILRKPPTYIIETGYLEVADANDIIMVFPLTWMDPKNMGLNFIGCWDIYSHTDPYRIKFATKWGYQPLAIKRMFEKIAYGNITSEDEFPGFEDTFEYKRKIIGRKFSWGYLQEALSEAWRAIGRLGL